MRNGAKRKQAAKPKRAAQIEPSSGNVFADLDLPRPDEDLARARLAQRIASLILERKLTQAQAATLLGIDQPKVSALMRGRIAGFSTDRLFRYLNALGRDVEIVIRHPARRGSPPAVRVVAASR